MIYIWGIVVIAIIASSWLGFYYYISRVVRSNVAKERSAVEERIEVAIANEALWKKAVNYNEVLLIQLKERSAALISEHNEIQEILNSMRNWDGDAENWQTIYQNNHNRRTEIENFFARSFRKDVYTWIAERESNLNNGTSFSLN